MSPSASSGTTAVAGMPGGAGVQASVRRGLLITGSPRSGTTWVGRMLALDPGLFYAHEPFNNRFRRAYPGLLGEPIKPYFRYVPVGGDYPPVSRFLDFLIGRSHAPGAGECGEWSAEERELLRDIEENRRQGAAPVIKDPIGVLSMEWVHHRYRIPVVAMVRHPAEFARSMIRLEWDTGPRKLLAQREFVETLPPDLVAEVDRCRGPQDPVRKAALMWKVLNLHVHHVAERNPNGIRVVRHEDLAGDPMRGFGEILDWLDLDREDRLREIAPYCAEENPDEPGDHWEIRRNSRANRDRWRGYFDRRQVELIRELVAPVDRLFDYSF